MADDDDSGDATVQMSADQLRRLHAELSAQGKIKGRAPPAAEEAQPAFSASDEDVAGEAAQPYAEEPAYEEPAYEEPAYEEPAYEEPAYEEQAYEEQAYEEQAYEEQAYEEQAYEEQAQAPDVDHSPRAYVDTQDYGEPVPAEPEPAPAPAAAPAKAKKEKKARKPKKAKAPKPAKARPAASSGGGAMLIIGGIGALVAGLSICLPILKAFQGMTMETWPVTGGTIGMTVGHLLLGLGMFGAVSRTNGVAALVGALHILATLGLGFFLLALFGVVALDNDMVPYILLIPGILPATAWLLSGIWGLAAGAGAMGLLHGIMALLGGGALITVAVGGLAGAFADSLDLVLVLQLAGCGLVLLASVFLAVAMFGRLRRSAA